MWDTAGVPLRFFWRKDRPPGRKGLWLIRAIFDYVPIWAAPVLVA
jgi:hypothetical protein